MPAICLYFQVHQPYRLKDYSFFKIGEDHEYEDEIKNRDILDRIATKCYLPTNQVLSDIIKEGNGEFKVAFSFSGTVLEQLERYRPDVITSFQNLVKTGCVEILSETYYHSLSYIYSEKEFERQVKMHSEKIRSIFSVTPKFFRNTELIYNNDIARKAASMGYKGILCEGVDRLLNERNPNFVYKPAGVEGIKCLLKNYKLSDDIAFRFSDRTWKEFPLTPKKYAKWIHKLSKDSDIINLFMDYETFGEHQWKGTGIFDFLRDLPDEILENRDFSFVTPSEALTIFPVRDQYDAPLFTSWADQERDLSAWIENKMQREAIQRIYKLENAVISSGDDAIIEKWSRLQTSDHFYYMSTKFWMDGEVHKYFSPYSTPYDAYINFMNVLSDFEQEVKQRKKVYAPDREGLLVD
jgi:alpha-amylase